MWSIEIPDVRKTLRAERAHIQKNLAKLDEAIAVLRELSGTNSTPTKTLSGGLFLLPLDEKSRRL